MDFEKTIKVGKDKEGFRIFLTVEYKEGKLSITGEAYKRKNGKEGYCGQIQDSLTSEKMSVCYIEKEDLEVLKSIWNKWHLNNLNPACAHQRKMGLDSAFRFGTDGENLLMYKCPVCGYGFGTQWKSYKVPQIVLSELARIFGIDDGKTKCFIVNTKDVFDKSKNPNLSLSAKDLLYNSKIEKKLL